LRADSGGESAGSLARTRGKSPKREGGSVFSPNIEARLLVAMKGEQEVSVWYTPPDRQGNSAPNAAPPATMEKVAGQLKSFGATGIAVGETPHLPAASITGISVNRELIFFRRPGP